MEWNAGMESMTSHFIQEVLRKQFYTRIADVWT